AAREALPPGARPDGRGGRGRRGLLLAAGGAAAAAALVAAAALWPGGGTPGRGEPPRARPTGAGVPAPAVPVTTVPDDTAPSPAGAGTATSARTTLDPAAFAARLRSARGPDADADERAWQAMLAAWGLPHTPADARAASACAAV